MQINLSNLQKRKRNKTKETNSQKRREIPKLHGIRIFLKM